MPDPVGVDLLEFEHIVQINDPEDAKVKPMTRAQLWEGLLLRARDPGKFNAALTCRLADEGKNGFTRYIQRLEPAARCDDNPDAAGSQCRFHISCPQKGRWHEHLWVMTEDPCIFFGFSSNGCFNGVR